MFVVGSEKGLIFECSQSIVPIVPEIKTIGFFLKPVADFKVALVLNKLECFIGHLSVIFSIKQRDLIKDFNRLVSSNFKPIA